MTLLHRVVKPRCVWQQEDDTMSGDLLVFGAFTLKSRACRTATACLCHNGTRMLKCRHREPIRPAFWDKIQLTPDTDQSSCMYGNHVILLRWSCVKQALKMITNLMMTLISVSKHTGVVVIVWAAVHILVYTVGLQYRWCHNMVHDGLQYRWCHSMVHDGLLYWN